MADDALFFDGKKFISAKRAAELTSYTSDYIGQISRAGKIKSRMVGRVRFVEEESLREYQEHVEHGEKLSEYKVPHEEVEPIPMGFERKVSTTSTPVFDVRSPLSPSRPTITSRKPQRPFKKVAVAAAVVFVAAGTFAYAQTAGGARMTMSMFSDAGLAIKNSEKIILHHPVLSHLSETTNDFVATVGRGFGTLAPGAQSSNPIPFFAALGEEVGNFGANTIAGTNEGAVTVITTLFTTSADLATILGEGMTQAASAFASVAKLSGDAGYEFGKSLAGGFDHFGRVPYAMLAGVEVGAENMRTLSLTPRPLTLAPFVRMANDTLFDLESSGYEFAASIRDGFVHFGRVPDTLLARATSGALQGHVMQGGKSDYNVALFLSQKLQQSKSALSSEDQLAAANAAAGVAESVEQVTDGVISFFRNLWNSWFGGDTYLVTPVVVPPLPSPPLPPPLPALPTVVEDDFPTGNEVSFAFSSEPESTEGGGTSANSVALQPIYIPASAPAAPGVSIYELAMAMILLREELLPKIKLAMKKPEATFNGGGIGQSDLDNYLPLSGGTLSGNLSGTNSTWSGLVTGNTLAVTGSTTFNGVQYGWPAADGATGQVLTTNGSGVLSWAAGGGGGEDIFELFNGTGIRATTTNKSLLLGSVAATSSTAILEIHGTSYFNGNVGIGTTSPNWKLSVVGPVAAEYFIATSTTATSTFAGAVGIGTTSPATRLSIAGAAPAITLANTTGGGRQYLLRSGGLAAGSFDVYDGTAGASRFTIDSGGNVAIGSSTISEAKLFVYGGANVDIRASAASESSTVEVQAHDFDTSFQSAYLQYVGSGVVGNVFGSIPNADLGRLVFQEPSNAAIYTTNTAPLIFGTNLLERARFTSDGNFGIGTTSPYAKFSVVGPVVAEYFHATSTSPSIFAGGFLSTASSTLIGNATTTGMHGFGSIFLNSEQFTDLTGTGLQNIAGVLTLNATGDWTGTFDGIEGAAYLARANHTGTQAASTITGGTFGAGSFIFPSGSLTSLGSSTLQDFTFANATGTAATTTTFRTGTLGVGSDYITDITGNLLTITSGALGVSEGSGSGLDADTLDTIDSLSFLRSDASDSYTSGTLTFDAGTALDLNTTSLSIADTGLVFDGASTDFAFTGDFTANTDDFVILKASGNIGIGTTSPWAKLSVAGASNGTAPLFSISTSTASATSTAFHIDSNGKVGIGNAAPVSQLHITGNVTIPAASKYYFATAGSNPDTNWALGYENGPAGAQLNTGSGVVQTVFDNSGNCCGFGYLIRNTNNVSLFEIDGGTGRTWFRGNVGLGETAPGSKLSVSGGGTFGAGYDTTSAPTNGLLVEGNVGIGTTSPYAKVSIHATSTQTNTTLFAIASSTVSATTTHFVVKNDGKVGIGTAAPSAKLDITKTVSTEEQDVTMQKITLTDSANYSTLTTTDSNLYLVSSYSGTVSNGNSFEQKGVFLDMDNTGTAGAGASSITMYGVHNDMQFGGSVNAAGVLEMFGIRNEVSGAAGTTGDTTKYGLYNVVAGTADLSYGLFTSVTGGTTNYALYSEIGTNYFGGNVGIGTTTPWGVLSVTNTGSAPSFVVEDSASPDSSPFLIDASGNVGISTTTPWGKLSVEMDTTNPSFVVANSGSTTPAFTIGGVNQNGNVGISTTTPWRTFSVNGTVGFSSSLTSAAGGAYLCIDGTTFEVSRFGAACDASSLRFKENVLDLSYGLDEVKALRPVFFNYKEDYRPDDSRRIGFIAEEVEGVIPEVVYYNDEGQVEAVSYHNLVALAIKAIQELAVRLDAIEARLAAAGTSIAGSVTSFIEIFTDKLTVGTTVDPTGITLFDEVTGEPYCLSVRRGETVTRPGECGSQNPSEGSDEGDNETGQDPPSEETPSEELPSEVESENESSEEPPPDENSESQEESPVEAPVPTEEPSEESSSEETESETESESASESESSSEASGGDPSAP